MLYVARQVAESKLAWVSFASTDSWRTSCQSGSWGSVGKPALDEYQLTRCVSSNASSHCTPVCPAGYVKVDQINVSSYVYWTDIALCKKV